MRVIGRHVTQDLHPGPLQIKSYNKLPKFYSSINASGGIRIDDEEHLEFWLEIHLTQEEIDKLRAMSDEQTTNSG